MATTNHERVSKALELLNQGLLPYLEQEMKAHFGKKWLDACRDSMRADRLQVSKAGQVKWDTQAILAVLWNHWNTVFKKTLGHAERSLVSELRDVRNRWAHQNGFSTDDAYRALDSVHRLLTAVAAMEAEEVAREKQQVLRVSFDEQARSQTRKKSAVALAGSPEAGLKPWRDVATPHEDVASGRYQQAEFAADLAQVYRGEGAAEYSDPEEFYRRTYPTEGLKDLLADALMRLSSKGGNPVIKLQTNFGGGKTHSMIALHHLFSGAQATKLAGIEPIMEQVGVESLPKASRAVLVGVALGPARSTEKDDGTVVNTLWGEMAWQLGGKEGFQLVAEADKTGVSPGSDALRELFQKAAPCLILIDEWIAYVRMLYGKDDLPSGSFDANLTFAQALTEAARAVPNVQVVATIPISPRVSDQHRDQIEIGGEAGLEALARLEHVFARMESPWRPASAEESFEIVRRRLFQPITDHVSRDAVVRRFSQLYSDNSNEFPQDCREGEYKRRMEAAYPIHPELFDRLYQDWSSLERFQLTRGVLRLMASVIHSLWERDDKSPMILPCMVPLDDSDVSKEMLRYLPGPWDSVVGRDIDGPHSLPLSLDRDNPNLGRLSACRKVARTVFVGSAPTVDAANRGIEDRRIKLGCAQPGESPAVFGDALRRLSDQATHLYLDKSRYWYATQPSVTRLAQDRAQQCSEDDVHEEIKNRLRMQQNQRAEFVRIHACPESSADVSDDTDTRLVILGPEYAHTAKADDSPGLKASKGMLESRGTIPRNCKNSLVFLSPDKSKLQDLETAVRSYLAWQSIGKDKEQLNLDSFQRSQADKKTRESDETANLRIPEAYVWAFVPTQPDAKASIEWQAIRVPGNESLAAKTSKKLIRDEYLITVFAGIRLRMELDRVPLWRGDHVEVRQLADDFAKYLYLPRLKYKDTLLEAIRDGLSKLSWTTETFAYANVFDDNSQRYLGLSGGQAGLVTADSGDLLVKPDIAMRQIEADKKVASETSDQGTGVSDPAKGDATEGKGGEEPTAIPAEKVVSRFYGSVVLDSARVGRDSGRIAEEVIQHLSGLMGSEVKVSLEIEAIVPKGVPDHVVRTVSENCKVLNFDQQGFEEE